jgi:hypothetical protein
MLSGSIRSIFSGSYNGKCQDATVAEQIKDKKVASENA